MASSRETSVAMSSSGVLQEAMKLEEASSGGVAYLKEKIWPILVEPFNVRPETYEPYFKALGKAYFDNDNDIEEAREAVWEDEAMNAIEDELYAEMCERLKVPDDPDDDLKIILDEAWDEAVEQIVTDVYLPEN